MKPARLAPTPRKPSKWQIVTGALKDAFTQLPARASVGLSFFNNNNDCGVNSQPSVGVKLLEQPQITALTSALDSVPAPKGGTPIIGATILAYKHLHQQAQAPGNRFVVVLTDGMESCDAGKLRGTPNRNPQGAQRQHPHLRDRRAGQRAGAIPAFANGVDGRDGAPPRLRPRGCDARKRETVTST